MWPGQSFYERVQLAHPPKKHSLPISAPGHPRARSDKGTAFKQCYAPLAENSGGFNCWLLQLNFWLLLANFVAVFVDIC